MPTAQTDIHKLSIVSPADLKSLIVANKSPNLVKKHAFGFKKMSVGVESSNQLSKDKSWETSNANLMKSMLLPSVSYKPHL